MFCTYDKTTKCGGSHRNSVYELKKIDSFTYLGCFIDQKERDLNGAYYFNKMNLEKCLTICSDLNFKYFGLQYGYKNVFCIFKNFIYILLQN